jgi:hypothetical protein
VKGTVKQISPVARSGLRAGEPQERDAATLPSGGQRNDRRREKNREFSMIPQNRGSVECISTTAKFRQPAPSGNLAS